MFDLEQVIRERHSTRLFCPNRCRERCWRRLSSWPSTRRRIPTSSRGTWCSRPGSVATASSVLCSRRPSVGHPTYRLARVSGTIEAN